MAPRKKTLQELRSEAIAELERRGYDVRGKTPAQIREILRRRPAKSKSDADGKPQKRPAQGETSTVKSGDNADHNADRGTN
jgi:hypothetical protein